MSTLLEEYNQIYKVLEDFRSRIDELNSQIDGIGKKRDEEIPKRIENLQNQLKKIDDYELKIKGFIQLAEKHMTSKNLPTIEAPPGYRVNLNRLRIWAMMIDPMAEDDTYAQRVYLVANCDLLFLGKKKEEFQAKIVELDNDYNIGAPAQIKELNEQIAGIKEKIRAYLESDAVNSFAANVLEGNESRMYQSVPAVYMNHEKDPDFLFPGAFGTAINVIEENREKFKLKLGMFFDEKTSKVYLPLERITGSEEFAMTISCVPARKKMNEMDAGIRNLLFQIIDKSPVGSRKLYIIDAVRQNSALVGGLKGLEGTAVLEPIPKNEEQIQQTLENIISSFSDIDDTLENYDTVSEYNSAVGTEKKIQRSVVVLVGWPNEFKGDDEEYARRIFSNYERYGVSFIAVKVSAQKDEEEEFGFSDYVGENIISISMTMKETTIKFGQEAGHSFAWYPFRYQLPSEYCDAIRSVSHGKGKKITDYSERGLLKGEVEYTRGKKLLDLPYGVDGKDQLHSIVFENENFASFLMGASGSGKSTFLHSLITGIIKNYHPDDVELWLADFKMSEFAQYINPMPPHVRYILLDESQELIFDLIDRLTEKMMERQRFFMKNRELKKVEKVPTDTYMPVIFVILDEFSIMSQAINDSVEYRLKLQNLLAKGRALGMKFLFSSQTFTTGVTGLTATAKAQIQMRIAMKAAKSEIVETLELSASQKTDQVQNWIDALPVYHALIKYREKSEKEDRVLVRRTTVLYFDDKDSPGKPYKKQEDLINKVNNQMHKVNEYNPNDIGAYVDKHPIVVDGNSYDMYVESDIRSRFDAIRAERGLDKDEILVSFGRPRLMTDMRPVSITQEARENILLFSSLNEQMCAASILVSMAKQFKMQGQKIQIWTYSRSKIFKTYEPVFSELGIVVRDMAAICDSIRSLKKKVAAKESGSDLILLLGMERICGDFAFADGAPAQAVVEGDGSLESKMAAMQQPVKSLTEDEEAQRQVASAWIKEKRRIKSENSGLAGKELNELLAKAKKDFFDKAAEEWAKNHQPGTEQSGETGSEATQTKEAASEIKEAEKDSKQQTEQTGEYNALGDLQYLLKQGSRYGYHFAAYLNNYADLKAAMLKAEWFRHRLSFQMSAEDSREVFGSKIASTLDEHICQYYDLLEGFSFRSYLNQGIDWDGWGVSESGELISPFN
ncbi:MAG: hypothetical protein K5871_08930 [Lachnospiraceae bacterium]|nr:hypothetical protein [Lachnospiraceae bacterium]